MQKTCIIIPCYNEEHRIDTDEFLQFARTTIDIDFLFINDGSADGTERILSSMCSKFSNRLAVHSLSKNMGKAEAVRIGISQAFKTGSYEYAGFWDADLATPLPEIPNFIITATTLKKKMVMGSRMKRMGASIERKAKRHILGRVFSTFASWILGLPVYDTQCGAKIFHKDLIGLFDQPFKSRWLFDIEIIARFRNREGKMNTLRDVYEYPLNIWMEKEGSKLRLQHMLKIPIELLKIHSTYN